MLQDCYVAPRRIDDNGVVSRHAFIVLLAIFAQVTYGDDAKPRPIGWWLDRAVASLPDADAAQLPDLGPYQLASLLVRADRIDDARQVAGDGEGAAITRMQVAGRLIQRGKFDEARREIDAIAKRYGEDVVVRIPGKFASITLSQPRELLIEAYCERGMLDEALAVRERMPKARETWHGDGMYLANGALAAALFRAGRDVEAEAAAKRGSYPVDAALLRAATWSLQADESKRADALIARVSEAKRPTGQSPVPRDVWLQYAKALAAHGRRDEAVRLLKPDRPLTPDDRHGLHYAIRGLVSIGREEDALKIASAEQPTHVWFDVILREARSCDALGKHDASEALFALAREAVAALPQKPDTLQLYLSVMRMQRGDVKGQLATAKRAETILRKQKPNAYVWSPVVAIARARLDAGDREGAKQLLQWASSGKLAGGYDLAIILGRAGLAGEAEAMTAKIDKAWTRGRAMLETAVDAGSAEVVAWLEREADETERALYWRAHALAGLIVSADRLGDAKVAARLRTKLAAVEAKSMADGGHTRYLWQQVHGVYVSAGRFDLLAAIVTSDGPPAKRFDAAMTAAMWLKYESGLPALPHELD